MTILPAKKKREKEPSQKSGASNAERPPSGQGSSSAKRSRPQEDCGPAKKRWAISPAGLAASPLSSLPNSSFHSPEEKKSRSSPGGDCNSDDEHHFQAYRSEENAQDEALFAQRLAARGLIIKEMIGDGACMFRAIAEQIYGDQEMHGQIRTLCMDYMENNRDHFREFITENYENYIRRKREENCHGNHVELQAISEMFARPVEVYQDTTEPIRILLPRPEHAPAQDGASSSNAAVPVIQQNAPLRLSYHGAVHYNAILQPNEATIGVGLGLPGMVPGAADKDLMSKAMATSEMEQIEEAMLQDKLDMTDFQRTQADLEDQVAQESLMSYLKEMEEKSSSNAASENGPSTSGPSTSSSSEPVVEEQSTSSGIGLYEEMLAAQSLDWDDDVTTAGAMLLSRQDYSSNNPGPSNSDGPSSSGSN